MRPLNDVFGGLRVAIRRVAQQNLVASGNVNASKYLCLEFRQRRLKRGNSCCDVRVRYVLALAGDENAANADRRRATDKQRGRRQSDYDWSRRHGGLTRKS